jgi:HAE1 family hydrophobic/amphiphilic exporter-1
VIGSLFHEFAVVVSLAIIVSALVSLHIDPDARGALPQAPAPRRPGAALDGVVRARLRAVLGALRAHARPRPRPRRVVLPIVGATLLATVALFMIMPKGFFPTEDIGQILITIEAVEDISFPAMVGAAARRWATC